ncbi:MAG: twin-arginine translocase TatA/TatE family subunit [Candidatus Sulfotelmatobacter sp.]
MPKHLVCDLSPSNCCDSYRGSMMSRVSFSETIFLFVLALIIFGPKKLPEIARQAGKMMNEFRRASNEFKSQIEQEIAHIEVEDRRKTMLPRSPAPEGSASRKPITTRGELTTLEAPATLAVSPESVAATAETANPPAVATEAIPPVAAGVTAADPSGEPHPAVAPPAAEHHESSESKQESHA